MKKLLFIIVIITLPIICFFQYKNWTKFSPPSDYDYVLSEKVDINYFDQEVVKSYFQNAQEIGSYARAVWHTDAIDVLSYDQGNLDSKNKVAYYNFLVAQTKQFEKLLEQSAELKAVGLNNDQIKKVFTEGISLEDFRQQEQIQKLLNLSFGDISQGVYQLQKKLSEKGYLTPNDGNFRTSTLEMLTKFQTENDLAPTGTTDRETLQKLFQ